MIIGACGFGSTGSSVVTDYLKEYNSFQVLDSIEFTWVSTVDGLIDLEYHLFHPHCRTSDSIWAIERYKQLCNRKAASSLKRAGVSEVVLSKSVNDFLSTIIQTSWKWNRPNINKTFWDKQFRKLLDKTRFVSRWEIKNGRQWNKYPYEDVFLSVKPVGFDEAARKHVRELLIAMGADFDKPIILDQPFSGNNPQACFKFFDDPYAIVVDRDPRDNYVFAKTKLLGKWHLMPIESVEEFVKYYRLLRKNQPYTETNDRIFSIRFEDMVYHYDETTLRLRNFLHLSDNPAPKSIFDPIISMPNTQVWKRFPQFAKDVDYIEKELSEYLYDFSGCPEPDPNGKMFYGRSPKNKK